MTPPTSAATTPKMRLRPSAGLTALVAASVVLGVATVRGLSSATRPLAWLIACSVLALVVSGVVARLERYIPRVVALVVTMLGLAVAIVGSWLVTIDTLRDQLSQTGDRMVDAAARLEERTEALADFGLAERVRNLTDEVGAGYEASALASRAAGTASAYVVTAVLLLFLVAAGGRFVRSAIDQFHDTDRRVVVERVVYSAGSSARRRLVIGIAQFVAGVSICFACFRSLDIEIAYVAALAAAALGTIPTIGYLIALPPAVLIASAEPGWIPATVVAVLLVALQAIEILVVRPRARAWSGIELGPAPVLVAAAIGHEIYGLGGAAYGAAIAVIVVAFADAIGRELDREGTAAGQTVPDTV